YSKKYANTNASKLLQNTTIFSYINKQLEELKTEKVADQQEILEYLTSIVRGEQQEQTLIGLGEGAQGVTDIDVSSVQRIKAAELLGKRYSMWTDKKEIRADVTPIFVDDISGEEDG
ncbi:MAG: terminase small subunit, partial [Staphylococcus equorum]|nr:terminase small subunit [Staphylococcus equorum]